MLAGRWDRPALAAAIPAGVLIVLAGALGAWSQDRFPASSVGWFTRSRIALALVVQGLGGHLSYGSGGARCVDDYQESPGDFGCAGTGDGPSYGISVVPLTFTLLWLLALVLALRSLRRYQAGVDAAVRAALLSAAAATVPAFLAQPSIGEVDFHSGPLRVLLWSFLLSLAAALAVLVPPGQETATLRRVFGTAFGALVTTALIAGAVVFVVAAAYYDELSGTGLVAVTAALPNLGLSGLALGWGAPLKLSDDTGFHMSVGLSRLDHVWDGRATLLALAVGVVCALVIGVWAAARSRDRAEQFLVAGVFTVLFTVLVAIGGLTTDGGIGLSDIDGGDTGRSTAGTSVPEALLFALLWSFGGVLVGPYVRRVFGGSPPRVVAYGAPQAPFGYGRPQPQPQQQRRVFGGQQQPRVVTYGTPQTPFGYDQRAPYPPPGSAPPPGGTLPGSAPRQGYPPPGPVPAQGHTPPPAPPQTPPPAVPPAVPPQPVVHDLGIVQPDRLGKHQGGDPAAGSGAEPERNPPGD